MQAAAWAPSIEAGGVVAYVKAFNVFLLGAIFKQFSGRFFPTVFGLVSTDLGMFGRSRRGDGRAHNCHD